MAEQWKWGAVETATKIRTGEASCEGVVTAHLDRMAATNPAVNAVTVDLSEQALIDAAAADEISAAGAATGVLHGVPVTIKENVDVASQATPNGLPALEALAVSPTETI
ncbi:MAG: amidase family protein [Acidimicrobiales bacterium]